MVIRSFNSLLAVLLFVAVLPYGAGSALAAEHLQEFFGSYVGKGTAKRVDENVSEERDLDVTVEPYKNDGFTLKWITVVRGRDGERVDEDVKRREVEENFIPLEGKEGVFILAPKGGLFQKAELPNPLRGEPMRWATIENGAMTVYSMAIGDEGGSELQVYRRSLTDKGMNISFLRLRDESVVVEMEGELVRTE